MDRGSIATAVNLFRENRLTPTPSERIADELRPHDIDQGYDLQNSLSALLEAEKGPVCGYKIGCTTPVMQEFLNISHPCAGCLYTNEVYDRSVTLRLADYVSVGIECEIAVQLNRDLPPMQTPYTQDHVESAVEAVMAAAELVDNRYTDFHDFGIPSLIADDFFSCGAVLGAPVSPAQLDLSTAKGTTLIGGEEAGSGYGNAVMGHPYEALAWLANLKTGRGEMLKAGDVVMTGSVVETQWIDTACDVQCQVVPLGGVRIQFV